MEADKTAAIGFLRLAPRALKPRLRGVTAVRGAHLASLARHEIAELVAAMGDWIDVLRVGDVPVPPKTLAAFVETAHVHQIAVARTGLENVLPLGASAVARFLDGARALGFDAVVLPARDEQDEEDALRLDDEVLKRGLLPHPELSMLRGRRVSATATLTIARRHLAAGAPLVVIGAAGITDGVARRRGAAIARLLNALGRERLMFEAPDPRTFTWYVRTWGHDLNLLVEQDQILAVERARAWAPAGPRATGPVLQQRS